ncbi:hypothetical protein [Tunicatimonas pelagia]|uniref:hypothetical protein n=1 Tax=Tunicatimonas pelagia TaxID=931531 RepID=UPI002666BC02|nr:hypothetical protein [Tunicatimonas pelagia]WKN43208.1 hypothetical protein P0M28_29635 [Tunicatimonas pelagia]
MRINIKHFLKTGLLSSIELGDSSDDVISIFGENYLLAKLKPKIEILKYENIEFTFRNKVLTMIALSFLNKANLLLLKEEGIPSKTDKFLAYLDKFDISYKFVRELTFMNQLCIETIGKTKVFFDNDSKELEKMILAKDSI